MGGWVQHAHLTQPSTTDWKAVRVPAEDALRATLFHNLMAEGKKRMEIYVYIYIYISVPFKYSENS